MRAYECCGGEHGEGTGTILRFIIDPGCGGVWIGVPYRGMLETALRWGYVVKSRGFWSAPNGYWQEVSPDRALEYAREVWG